MSLYAVYLSCQNAFVLKVRACGAYGYKNALRLFLRLSVIKLNTREIIWRLI